MVPLKFSTAQTPRQRELDLDQQQARRFNALDYLRTDELGLSRIVADLLDPHGTHGQGTSFLDELLVSLRESTPLAPGIALDRNRISVALEQVITSDRRIDIVVEIAEGQSRHALAIENKPYAGDQKHQVQDYLRFLRGEYGQNFLLIYLSPTGEGPSDWSISRRQLHANWQGRFAILPYHREPAVRTGDAFGAFPVPYSLTEWLAACRAECKVDRLR